MRIRTVRGACEELRAADPKCAIGRTTLYRLAAEGIIPSIQVGTGKIMVDLDTVEEYFSSTMNSGQKTRLSAATPRRAAENRRTRKTARPSVKKDTTADAPTSSEG